MDTHPGGKEVTLKLLELAQMKAGGKIIDLGSGYGESISLLKEKGFDGTGIDLKNPQGPVLKGDMCALNYGRESFDGALAECSFSVCGNLSAALAESARVLKIGGKLLISDIYYLGSVPEASLFPGAVTMEDFKRQVWQQGFQIQFSQDISEVLKTYYLESVWRGEYSFTQVEAEGLNNLKLGYFMMICVK